MKATWKKTEVAEITATFSKEEFLYLTCIAGRVTGTGLDIYGDMEVAAIGAGWVRENEFDIGNPLPSVSTLPAYRTTTFSKPEAKLAP